MEHTFTNLCDSTINLPASAHVLAMQQDKSRPLTPHALEGPPWTLISSNDIWKPWIKPFFLLVCGNNIRFFCLFSKILSGSGNPSGTHVGWNTSHKLDLQETLRSFTGIVSEVPGCATASHHQTNTGQRSSRYAMLLPWRRREKQGPCNSPHGKVIARNPSTSLRQHKQCLQEMCNFLYVVYNILMLMSRHTSRQWNLGVWVGGQVLPELAVWMALFCRLSALWTVRLLEW